MERRCKKCGEVKDLSSFRKRSGNRDGYSGSCKACDSERDKRYRDSDPERYKEYARQNWEKHREKRLKYHRDRKEQYQRYWQEWKQKNPEAYKRNLIAQRGRIQHRLHNNLSRRVRHALNGNVKSGHTHEYIGIDIAGLKQHIESQFEDWMTWDNYRHDVWHIDHIIPCSAYDLSDREEALKCFNYRNMRPLSATDNFEKKSDIDMGLIDKYGLYDLMPKTMSIDQSERLLAV